MYIVWYKRDQYHELNIADICLRVSSVRGEGAGTVCQGDVQTYACQTGSGHVLPDPRPHAWSPQVGGCQTRGHGKWNLVKTLFCDIWSWVTFKWERRGRGYIGVLWLILWSYFVRFPIILGVLTLLSIAVILMPQDRILRIILFFSSVVLS